MNKADTTLAGQLQAIIAAGRQVKLAVDEIDRVCSKTLGVQRGDFRCLVLLEAGPATPGEVGAATGLTSGSVTALLDRLEGGGFVERRRSCSDRRSVEVAMPGPQRAELAKVAARVEAGIREHFADRDAAELDAIAAALVDFSQALHRVGADMDAPSD